MLNKDTVLYLASHSSVNTHIHTRIQDASELPCRALRVQSSVGFSDQWKQEVGDQSPVIYIMVYEEESLSQIIIQSCTM